MSHRPPSGPVPSRRRPLAAVAALALVATAASGGIAQAAAPYAEVVSRATGVAGSQPAVIGTFIGAVSSDGRWTAFSGNPSIKQPAWDGVTVQPPDYYLYVRDIVSNTTYQVTTNKFAFAGDFDDAGRYLTYTTFDASTSSEQLWIVDTTRKTTALVGRATGASGAAAEAAAGLVSGDGTSVVFTSTNVPGSGPGIYRRTLATGVTTRLGDLPQGPSTQDGGPSIAPQPVRSISKDGSVITFDEQPADGVGRSLIVSPGKRVEVEGVGAVVSADGSTIAYLSDGVNTPTSTAPERLVFRNVATGAETSYPAPAGAGTSDGTVAWITSNGSQAVVAPNTPISFGGVPYAVPYHAQLFDRASKTYSPAGPFANALYAPVAGGLKLFGNTAVSRNGRYSLFSNATGALVGDNYGAALPGGADLPPANSYFAGPAQYCQGETSTNVTSHLTPNYLPPAKSLTGVVTIDGNYGGQDTFTTDRTTSIPLPASAKTVSIKATVTFTDGRTTTDTYVYGVHNSPFC